MTPLGLRARSSSGRTASLALAAAAFLFAVLRFYAIGRFSLWSDEVFTMGIVGGSWRGLLPAVARDVVHPPLFYVVLKVWTGIGGDGLVWLRLLPVLISIATLLPFVALCRELGLSDAVAAVALLLAAPNAFVLEYSQQVRMYAPLLFLTVVSLWLFARLERSRERVAAAAAALTAVNVLLVYTQYYGWVVVGLEGLYLLLFRRERLLPMIVSAAVTAAAFAPWAVRVVAEARAIGSLAPNLGWMRRPDARDVAAYFASLHGPYREGLRLSGSLVLAGFVIFGIPILLLLVSAWRRRGAETGAAGETDARVVLWLLFFALGPVAVSLAASRILPVAVFEARHMLIAVVPYDLLCAAAALDFRPRAARAAAVSVMVAWAWIGGVVRLPNRDVVSWGTLVEHMVESPACGAPAPSGEETIYVIGRASMIPIEYYWNRLAGKPVAIRLVTTPSGLPPEAAWFAFQESLWGGWTSASVRAALSADGKHVTCDFASGISGHQGHLLRWEPDRE